MMVRITKSSLPPSPLCLPPSLPHSLLPSLPPSLLPSLPPFFPPPPSLSLSQVGAVVVDPESKEVVGTGWNRMPRGCEDRFKWTRDKEKEPLESGKHYYGTYVIHSA